MAHATVALTDPEGFAGPSFPEVSGLEPISSISSQKSAPSVASKILSVRAKTSGMCWNKS